MNYEINTNDKNELKELLGMRIKALKPQKMNKFYTLSYVVGTTALYGASISEIDTGYFPAVMSAFSLGLLGKIIHNKIQRHNKSESVNIDFFKEEFLNSGLSPAAYANKQHLSAEERENFFKALVPKKDLEGRFIEAVDIFTGDGIPYEEQLEHHLEKQKEVGHPIQNDSLEGVTVKRIRNKM